MPAGSRVEQDQLFTRKLLLLPACLPVLLAYARGRELRGEWALAFAIYRVVFIAWPTLPTAPLRSSRHRAPHATTVGRPQSLRIRDAPTARRRSHSESPRDRPERCFLGTFAPLQTQRLR